MRLFALAASILAGMLIGGWLMLTAQDAAPVPSTVTTTTAPTAGSEPATTSTGDGTSVATTRPAPGTSPPLSDEVLLVWTPGRLPDGLAQRVDNLPGVSATTTVRSGVLHLREWTNTSSKRVETAPEGYVVPIEAMAFDASSYPEVVGSPGVEPLESLGSNEAVLGSTSAGLRALGSGGRLTLEDGTTLTVADVVDDVLVGAAEVAVSAQAGAELGVDTERYLLVRYSGNRKMLEDAVREELPDGLAARIRAPGETPVLRHGDAVLPQAMIKEVFGEFAYRPATDTSFEVDPRWREANIVTGEVPLLGRLRCHRNLFPALRGAMEELQDRNLASLVHRTQGCFNPRYIAGGKGISRHAWGAAVDINISSNPEGLESIQDPRLVDVMERWGFTSGHEWLIPDPGHFEYVRPPE